MGRSFAPGESDSSGEDGVKESSDFSLVLGGPLYQFLLRSRLAGDALQLLRRRLIVLTLLAWLPLLLSSVAEGHAWGGSVKLPFLHDVELHVRLLLAVPLLILAELVIHGLDMMLLHYDPLEPWFDKTWRPGEIEMVK